MRVKTQTGLVVMGDAAHTMSPNGGVGVNVAMKDAEVLAPILVKSLQAGDTVGANFSLYPSN
jgi:2-polyprenyl-6-methoxyphenol hydroxylase-like FAD-dependent oxidoreductase